MSLLKKRREKAIMIAAAGQRSAPTKIEEGRDDEKQ